MNDRLQKAMLGALVADAVSMPVHWYYDTNALDRDYPDLQSYQTPRNPHPDSILWRSKYKPRNYMGKILHDQAQYWGQREVHYHQFLPAGENTVNFLLGVQLYLSTTSAGRYDPKSWIHQYIFALRTPGWHRDTYLEEYHRAFFDNLAQGKNPMQCGIKDIHIGGLTPVPFLLAALDYNGEHSLETILTTVESHLALTHHGREIREAGRALTRILFAVSSGSPLRQAIVQNASDFVYENQLQTWSAMEDRDVVGRHLTPACYLPDSFKASLYLAWKYHADFSAGVIANARCGGDNSHRGAVVGSLLGAAQDVPERWLHDLKSRSRLLAEPDSQTSLRTET